MGNLKQSFKNLFAPTELSFVLESGIAYSELTKPFNKQVKRCNFPRRPDTLFYSPYSLRHTFATFALAEGRGYAWLEEVMGTRTKMLRDPITSRALLSRPRPICGRRVR